jgi:hypothetical protein
VAELAGVSLQTIALNNRASAAAERDAQGMAKLVFGLQ